MISDGLLLEFDYLSRSLGADLYSFGSESVQGFSSVTIDSRSACEGSFFVAIPGAVHDGHSFVETALANGACAALVERSKLNVFDLVPAARRLGKILVAVDDTLLALQAAAKLYLERFPRLVKIGITGSSGKTTTKEITAAIISQEKKIVINPGNYNSETGLPLSVFAVRPEHEVGIFEMGSNKKGEIAALASVLQPHIALITNIGSAHIGIFGSKEAIAEEKKAVFSCFNDNCTALVPAVSPFRDYLVQGVRGTVSFYGENTFSRLLSIQGLGIDGTEITWAGKSARFALPGRHCLADAVAAIAIAKTVSVSDEAVRRGLESVRPLFGRGEIIRGRVTILQDGYNSNPESLAAAAVFCDSLDWPGRRIYVIGEMLELGENACRAHEEAGRLLAASRADMVFLYGKETAAAAAVFSNKARFFHTINMDELSRVLGAFVRDGDLVLLKGSRGCTLERLVSVLSDEALAAASITIVGGAA